MQADRISIIHGDSFETLRTLPAESVHACVTSPPYWGLRNYGIPPSIIGGDKDCDEHEWQDEIPGSNRGGSGTPTDKNNRGEDYGRSAARGQFCAKCGAWRGNFGLEPTPELYVAHSVLFFREVRRVLRKDGTLWVNLGDSYAGGGRGGNPADSIFQKQATNAGSLVPPSPIPHNLKPGDLVGIPWRVALALQADGWWLRRDNIWHKPNPMPESVSGWTWLRHMIKRSEYERLQKLRESQRVDQNRPADLSRVPGRKTKKGADPVSFESEGNSDDKGARSATVSKGETPGVQRISEGQGKTGVLCDERERPGDSPENREAIQSDREGEDMRSTSGQKTPIESRKNRKAERVSSEILENHQWASDGGEARCPTPRLDEISKCANPNPMEADSNREQGAVLLVPEEGSKADGRPCDSTIEAGEARSEQCRTGVPVVQLDEERQDSDALVACPGCKKCEKHGGYVLRKGAWRTTTAHEYVFQFSKSADYFCDAEAVKEQTTGGNGINLKIAGKNSRARRDRDVQHSNRVNKKESISGVVTGLVANRNMRSVWRVPTKPFRGAHFATFPPRLIEPIIRAAVPKQCCSKCGAPWAPVVLLGEPDTAHQRACGGDSNGEYHGKATKDFALSGAQDASAVKARILAGMRKKTIPHHKPTCRCDAPAMPGTVLDPFGGSGTTGEVAMDLGVHAILLELNPDYLPMIDRRIHRTPGLGI